LDGLGKSEDAGRMCAVLVVDDVAGVGLSSVMENLQ
jgi:hypothetical protein